MDFNEQFDEVESREDLVAYIDALRQDLLANGSMPDWENPTLERFLESLAAWMTDWGDRLPETPSWKFVGQMFAAAKIYE